MNITSFKKILKYITQEPEMIDSTYDYKFLNIFFLKNYKKKYIYRYPYLGCELLTKNIVILSQFFVKNKSCQSSEKTIKRKNSIIEEEMVKLETTHKKSAIQSEDLLFHKSSNLTCKLDQKFESMVDLEEENEFLSLLFSFLNDENCNLMNETLCGYFQKLVCDLITQIRNEVKYGKFLKEIEIFNKDYRLYFQI